MPVTTNPINGPLADTTRYISVVESGQYHVDVTNQFGLVIHSDLLETTVVDPAQYTSTVTAVLCNNQANRFD